MTKRNIILSAALSAVFAGVAGVASAGTITTVATKYAVEGIATTATPVTLADVVYNLGVARTTAQPFTLIYTLAGGAVFNATPAVPTAAGGTCAIAGSALKRGGANSSEVAFDITVSGACAATDTLTLVAPVIKTHGLTTNGATVSMTVALKDSGETSFIDNAGALSSVRATAAYAADFYNTAATAAGVANDTATVINVNATTPLAGFVVANDDTATRANASVRVNNTTALVQNATNTGAYTLGATDLVTLTVTDATGFLGAAATNPLCYNVDGDATFCETGEVFTISGNTATLAAIPGNSAGFNVDQLLSYNASGTTSMGTGRTLGIAGSVAPAAGANHAFTGNGSFWTWTSNGVSLQSPWFSTAAGYISRFVLTNTGTTGATYSSQCLAETGNTATLGTASTGSIPPGGQLVLNATDVCTFSGASRGAILITVNAPTANIQGAYNIVNPTTGSITVSNMMRPGTN